MNQQPAGPVSLDSTLAPKFNLPKNAIVTRPDQPLFVAMFFALPWRSLQPLAAGVDFTLYRQGIVLVPSCEPPRAGPLSPRVRRQAARMFDLGGYPFGSPLAWV